MFTEYRNKMAGYERGDTTIVERSFGKEETDVHQPSTVKKGLWKNGHPVSNTGRTWWKKGRIPWNKGLHGYLKIELRGKWIKCGMCGTNKYFQPNQLKRRPCKFCSVACARKSERKTDLVYSSVHSRIRVDWGKASICEICGTKTAKMYDWANISGRYLLKKSDWKQLCRKCHIDFDKSHLPGSFKRFTSR